MSSAAMNVTLGFIVIAFYFVNSMVVSCELHAKPLAAYQCTLDGVTLLQM